MDDNANKIIEMLRKGITASEIAKEIGCSETHVYDLKRKDSENGFQYDIFRKRKKTIADYNDVILKMRENKCSYEEIARKVGYSVSTVKGYVHKIEFESRMEREQQEEDLLNENTVYADDETPKIRHEVYFGKRYINESDFYIPR